jgi:hypothetical protein
MGRPKGSKNKVRAPRELRLPPDVVELMARSEKDRRWRDQVRWWFKNRPPKV